MGQSGNDGAGADFWGLFLIAGTWELFLEGAMEGNSDLAGEFEIAGWV